MRILIINPFGIGDVLFSTPLIRAVRQAFPESWIGYLCNRRTESILRVNPHLDELFIYEKDDLLTLWRASWGKGLAYFLRLIDRIRRARFDLVIDLSLGERYGLITALVGIRQRMGFDYRWRGRFLTERLPIDGYQDDHIVGYYRRLLRFLGIALVDDALELPVSSADAAWADEWLKVHGLEEEQPLVGMVPAGGVSWGKEASFRRWSLEGFAAVGDVLAARYDARIILFGEPTDRQACQAVGRLMKHPSVDLSGKTSLGQFVGLLGRLHLVICNDGGPLHLAVSQGVRTVSIFGPVDPRVYGPYAPNRRDHAVIARQDLLCRPCYHRFRLPPCPYERACLTTIDLDEVIEACATVLGKQESRLR